MRRTPPCAIGLTMSHILVSFKCTIQCPDVMAVTVPKPRNPRFLVQVFIAGFPHKIVIPTIDCAP